MDPLKVGDVVLWRGAWGSEAPARARVTSLTLCEEPGVKWGQEVTQLPWWVIRHHERAVIVGLDNGHWAWGSQVSPQEGGR